MFQGEKPLRTASPRCGRVEEVELSVNVHLTVLFSTTPTGANYFLIRRENNGFFKVLTFAGQLFEQKS
jgi:hypothetical protein